MPINENAADILAAGWQSAIALENAERHIKEDNLVVAEADIKQAEDHIAWCVIHADFYCETMRAMASSIRKVKSKLNDGMAKRMGEAHEQVRSV